ncbi:MAG: hypothetical protein EPN47_17625 [Acidobacteria bacterium]|jgi:hypothetical protein|nr:MAG: hypothetical protein EPN47_17625 [Acidobacteriota bacterium]
MMKEMMEKVMDQMAKPEDMPDMMNAMMEQMLRGMTADERIRFVTTMMPKCLGMIMAEMKPEDRQKLAREMVDRLVAVFQAQVGGASPLARLCDDCGPASAHATEIIWFKYLRPPPDTSESVCQRSLGCRRPQALRSPV